MIQRLSHNGWLKILSLALAVILWIYVSAEEQDVAGREVSRTFENIQLSVRNQPEDLILIDDPPTIEATLRGTRAMMDRIDEEQLMFFIDLDDLEAGTHTVPVEASIPQFEVARIEPPEVEINLEEKIEAEMPVSYRFEGTPAEGLTAQEPELDPQTVMVSGAQSHVEAVFQVVVDINIDEVLEELETSLVVELEDEAGEPVENVEVSPGMVEVFVPMDYPQTELAVTPEIEDDLEDYYLEEVDVTPDTVTVSGWESVIQEIDVITTEVILLSDLLEQETVIAALELPEGIKEISEESVAVTGLVNQAEETEIEVPLQVDEALEALAFTPQQEEVQVTLAGEPAEIANLTAGDVLVYVVHDEPQTIGDGVSELELSVEIDMSNDQVKVMDKTPDSVILTR